MEEFTLAELNIIRKGLVKLMAENEYNIEKLEEKFTDHVELYKTSTYTERLQTRDVLASAMSKLIETTAQKQYHEKVLMN